MIRMTMTVLAVVFLTAMFSSSASAEQQATKTGPTRVGTIISQEQLCEMVRQCRLGRGSEQCERAHRANRRAIERRRGQLETYERRIAQLEDRLGGLTDRDAELEAALDDLRGLVSQLTVRIEALYQFLSEVEEIQPELARLREGQAELSDELQQARDRITALEDQINQVDQREGVIQLSFNGGYLLLSSMDGPLYNGFFIGSRLSLRITRLMAVFGELQYAASIAENPSGIRGRGGLMLAFLRDRLMLEIGGGVTWTGYDQHLDAESSWLMADLGIEYRPHQVVGIGVNGLIGVEFDQDEAELAGGFSAQLNLHIPWF